MAQEGIEPVGSVLRVICVTIKQSYNRSCLIVVRLLDGYADHSLSVTVVACHGPRTSLGLKVEMKGPGTHDSEPASEGGEAAVGGPRAGPGLAPPDL